MNRLFLLVVFSLVPGCVAFGYPSVTATPQVANLGDDVHAFKSAHTSSGTSIVLTGGEQFSSSVDEILLRHGALDAQKNAYFAYYVGGIPVSFCDLRSWEILLYRPGYEVIEIPGRWWCRALFEGGIDKLSWNPASNIESHVKAIERVCPHPQWCTVSADVRRFAANEYARLSSSPELATEQRDNLMAKARRLQSD